MGNICTSSKNDLYGEDRPIRNTERGNKTPLVSSRPEQIDKWDVDDVFEWLSTIDDGALYELATKFRTSRIRGRILDQLTESQLKEMGVPLGDRMHFKKVRNELFTQCRYMVNSILYDQHSNPISHISNHSHPSSHSNNNEGEVDAISHISHISHPLSSVKSLPQNPPPTQHIYPGAMFKQHSSPLQPPMPYYNKLTHPQQCHLLTSSSTSAVAQNDSLHSIEENHYGAVDARLIEGIEDYTKKDITIKKYKPPLNRSCSADEYKKPNPPCITAHVFNKSVSNPTIMSRQSHIGSTSRSLDIMKIANILKDVMKLDVQTGQAIVDIIKDKDKCQELFDLKLLNRVSSDTIETKMFCVTDEYEFNHAILSSSSKPNIPNIHINSDQNFMGGTQVHVYSPKSNKWRQGLILDYDENTSFGRICCYNSMGKQSIKQISLPSDCVRHSLYMDTPHNIPMTADSWNRNIRDRHTPSQPF